MSNAPVADRPAALDTTTERESQILSGNEPHSFSPAVGSEGVAEVALRTYRGRTVEELIPKIQSELGADAIILGRREGLTGGLAGFFQRPFVEIEAMAGGPQVDVYDEPSSVMPSAPAANVFAGDPVAVEPPLVAPRPSVSPRTPFYEREPQGWRPDGAYVSEHLAALARARQPQPPVVTGAADIFQEDAATEVSRPFAAELERATSTSERANGSERRPVPRSRGRAQTSVERQLLELGVGERFAA